MTDLYIERGEFECASDYGPFLVHGYHVGQFFIWPNSKWGWSVTDKQTGKNIVYGSTFECAVEIAGLIDHLWLNHSISKDNLALLEAFLDDNALPLAVQNGNAFIWSRGMPLLTHLPIPTKH